MSIEMVKATKRNNLIGRFIDFHTRSGTFARNAGNKPSAVFSITNVTHLIIIHIDPFLAVYRQSIQKDKIVFVY